MRTYMDHTVLPANGIISAYIRKHFQVAPPRIYAQRTLEFNLLLIYRPQQNEWLSWPCWLTYSRWFTPTRSPVNCTSWRRPGKVRRSQTDVLTTVLRHQHLQNVQKFAFYGYTCVYRYAPVATALSNSELKCTCSLFSAFFVHKFYKLLNYFTVSLVPLISTMDVYRGITQY